MKLFDADGKINFVDENNVFVGYDMSQWCCEAADWFISKDKTTSILDTIEIDFDNFVFDINFFEESPLDDTDEGDSVCFKLVSKDGSEYYYLYLYNVHNGYYGHGFTMKLDGQIILSGSL